ncbi:MAG: WYL domain-containing protein, partial [Bacteroidota bacterium]
SYLSEIQRALTHFQLVKIRYQKLESDTFSEREVEPFAIYHNTAENWVLIAWCRLREEYRNFRIDRILELEVQSTQFKPHEMTLDEYVEIQRKKHFNEPLT